MILQHSIQLSCEDDSPSCTTLTSLSDYRYVSRLCIVPHVANVLGLREKKNDLIDFDLIRYMANCKTSIQVLLDFSLTVNAATLIFISWCGSAFSSAKEGKSGLIYNLVKS